jgi:hypothetical protein
VPPAVTAAIAALIAAVESPDPVGSAPPAQRESVTITQPSARATCSWLVNQRSFFVPAVAS